MEVHMQAWRMFALVFSFVLRARAARTCCHRYLAVKNPNHDEQAGLIKTGEKSWTVTECGHVTLNSI